MNTQQRGQWCRSHHLQWWDDLWSLSERYDLHHHQIPTQVSISGRYWTGDESDSALHHHCHQIIKWGNIFWSNVLRSSSRVQGLAESDPSSTEAALVTKKKFCELHRLQNFTFIHFEVHKFECRRCIRRDSSHSLCLPLMEEQVRCSVSTTGCSHL